MKTDILSTTKISSIKIHLDQSLKNYVEDFSLTSLNEKVKRTLGIGSKNLIKEGYKEDEEASFDFFSISRSAHQLNESCNKLWGTIEFANICYKEDRLCKSFTRNFSCGTLIPGLYYSHLSALVAIMCTFGCISFRDPLKRKNYFLVRTNNDWKLIKRGEFIQNILKKDADGWHDEVIKTYEGLVEHGIELPELDIEQTNKLRNIRNKMHYYILGDLSMQKYFGIQDYFEFLPLVLSTVSNAIDLLKTVYGDSKEISKRFSDICDNVEPLYDLHNFSKENIPKFILIPPERIEEESDSIDIYKFLGILK